jgi:iron complex transport system ATP-binding protein
MMGRLPHQEGSFFESERDFRKVEEALEATDSLELAARPFNALSGGERQLVVLAGALAQEPAILLLDEPTAFLDLKHQLQIHRILDRLHARGDVTLILATHDLNLAQSFCTRLILLKRGQLVADLPRSAQGGPPELTAEILERVFDVSAEELAVQGRQQIVLSYR